jgi:site-specific recombinase XerD
MPVRTYRQDSVALTGAREGDLLPALADLGPSERNPVSVFLAKFPDKDGKKSKSRKSMEAALLRILRALGSPVDIFAFPWASMTYGHVAATRAALANIHAYTTVNHAMSALRGVLREAFRLDLISSETWARIKDVEGVKGERLLAGRFITEEEMSRMFKACDRPVLGVRDAALLAVLKLGGMRLAELCTLTLARVNLEDAEATVLGKGNKERKVYFADAMPELLAWLELRGKKPGRLFYSFNPASKTREPLSESGVYVVLNFLAERAGIAPLSAHDVRRTFISNLLDEGEDISSVQRLVGHAQVSTTQRYDRRPDEILRKVAAKIKVPR